MSEEYFPNRNVIEVKNNIKIKYNCNNLYLIERKKFLKDLFVKSLKSFSDL